MRALAARPELTPLAGLRVRTPRLELRLGTDREVLALGALAETGVHPADEMPFAVAWTDDVGSAGFVDRFVDFHEAQLEAWQPLDWTLNLLVWDEGVLVGTQGLSGERFATGRTVATGSWLGATYQGRGIGTEMRAAVLELAFAGLGADAATSSWLEGNDASRRVSEKLGYVVIGEVTRSPRPGESVRAWDVRRVRDGWRCPVRVTVEGLEPCLPLFGPPSHTRREPVTQT
jgi:RimJ/RimL family protein N-acetyltransferase